MNLFPWKPASLLGLFPLLLTGCPNPNVYGTPRTTAKGEISHTVAAEALSIRGESTMTSTTTDASGQPVTRTTKEDVSVTVPTFPTYQIRYGVGDEVDLGFSVRNLSSLGADVKYNPVRGKSLDLAIDPGFQFFRLSSTASDGSSASVNVAYLHLPLLLGLNLGSSATLVLTPGGVVALASGSASNTSGRDSVASSSGFLARFGLGLNLRISPSFALQPEVTAMRQLSDTKGTIFLAGLGFNFGKLPTF
ncbi:MAG: hypothetical protein RMJ98_00320 [Myxococcales bacterium]|nr:hypothetical protein [Myxococcales bacterium]